MGRKGKWTEVNGQLDKIKEYARNGFLNKEIAEMIGISEASFYEYCKKYPEFSEAIRVEKNKADHEVLNSLYKSATGYDVIEEHLEYTPATKGSQKTKIKSVKKVKKHIKPNLGSILVWIFNRRKAQWKQRLMEMPDNLPKIPELENLSDEELLQAIISAQNKLNTD